MITMELRTYKPASEVRPLACKLSRIMAALISIIIRRVWVFPLKLAASGLGFAISVALSVGVVNASMASEAHYEQVFSDRNATGEQLANAFFDLLSDTGSPADTVGTTPEQDDASKKLVRPFLDQAFQLQRSSGERYTAETYLPADVDDFEIGDVREARPSGNVLVVRYSVRTTETLLDAALVMSKDKAPRLTAFHWSEADSRWKLLSHANFNTPVAAICDKDPIFDNGLESSASPEDQALGEGLMRRFYDLLVQGDAAPILNSQLQYQSASGVGYTSLAERKKPTKLPETTFTDTVVTRNDSLLVVSVYHQTMSERVLMQQTKLRAGKSANLATFMQDKDGGWSMIALASFVPGKELPEGAECVHAGKLENAP